MCVCVCVCVCLPPLLHILSSPLKSFLSLMILASFFMSFFSPPEGKITYPQKPRVACFKAMDKIQIFENVFHGNYVKFHGPGTALSHSLDALICIEIVIICSFQGENCIF